MEKTALTPEQTAALTHALETEDANVAYGQAAILLREAAKLIDEAKATVYRTTGYSAPLRKDPLTAALADLTCSTLQNLSSQVYWQADAVRGAGNTIADSSRPAFWDAGLTADDYTAAAAARKEAK